MVDMQPGVWNANSKDANTNGVDTTDIINGVLKRRESDTITNPTSSATNGGQTERDTNMTKTSPAAEKAYANIVDALDRLGLPCPDNIGEDNAEEILNDLDDELLLRTYPEEWALKKAAAILNDMSYELTQYAYDGKDSVPADGLLAADTIAMQVLFDWLDRAPSIKAVSPEARKMVEAAADWSYTTQPDSPEWITADDQPERILKGTLEGTAVVGTDADDKTVLPAPHIVDRRPIELRLRELDFRFTSENGFAYLVEVMPERWRDAYLRLASTI